MPIASSVFEIIGHTPLVELGGIMRKYDTKARILAKVEALNPGGSVKDRVAAHILETYARQGILKPGAVLVEPTSGNTGIGLCMLSAAKGYRCVIVMPENMSDERKKLMRAFGAQLVCTPAAQGMAGAIAKAEAIVAQTPGAVLAGQFTNPANPAAHYATTGPEIWQDTEGQIDAFVAGVGTGGTLTGTGRYLRERNPAIHLCAVEPDTSAVLSGAPSGAHGIQGIGAGFVPQVLDTQCISEILRVTDQEAYAFGRDLACVEGLLCGISSGAALCAAVRLAGRDAFAGKTIVTLLPDTGDRYLSTGLFSREI